MTPDDLRAFRKRLGLSQARFAAMLPAPVRTVVNWESKGDNHRNPPEYLARALRDVERELAAPPDPAHPAG